MVSATHGHANKALELASVNHLLLMGSKELVANTMSAESNTGSVNYKVRDISST